MRRKARTRNPEKPDQPRSPEAAQTARPAEKPDYVIREAERAVLQKHRERVAAQWTPTVKVEKSGGKEQIKIAHPIERTGFELLMEALATGHESFVVGLIEDLALVASRSGAINEAEVNFMLSVIKGIQPRDQIESMLAAQMAAVHSATMVSARVLGRADTIAKLDSAERAFNKLARTFTTQMEALKRYRSGGEQKVTVQHVSVSDGGQAIVGHVTHAPREPSPAPAPPAKMAPAALTQSQEAPMPLIVEAQPAAPTATKPSNARPRWGPKK